jgi:HK97 family phage portal protein
MRLLGLDIYWRDPQHRALDSVEVTDLGLAFDERIADITGRDDASIPALFRGVMFLANRVAGLPMEQLQGVERVPADRLLTQPETGVTYREAMIKVMYSLLFRGNAYLWPRTRNGQTGRIESVKVLHPDDVVVTPDTDQLYPTYRWRGRVMSPASRVFNPRTAGSEILHIPLNLFPGRWVGLSPISAARVALEGAKAEQAHARDLMVNGGPSSGILKIHRTELTDTEAEAALDRWNMARKRAGARGGPRVMGELTDFEPLTFDPIDMQFIEQRRFSVQDIARMLGLDPFFLGEQSGGSMTYSTTESLLRLAVTQTIGPDYLEPIEQAFSMMLPEGQRARFNVDEILRADMEARYRAYETGITAGFLTINEARAAEGLSPVAGGDKLAEPASRLSRAVGALTNA